MKQAANFIIRNTIASPVIWSAVGVASIVAGCWQVYPPSAYLVFGGLILFAVYRIVNNRGNNR